MALDPNMLMALGGMPQQQLPSLRFAGLGDSPAPGQTFGPILRPPVPIEQAPPGSIPNQGMGERTPAPAPTPALAPVPAPTPASGYPGGTSTLGGQFARGAAGDILRAGTAGAMYAGGTPWDLSGSVGGTIGNAAGAFNPVANSARYPGSPGVRATPFPTTPNYMSGEPTGQEPGSDKTGKLADALRGVKAPAPPQAQTVRTPPPPQVVPIRGGEFVSMLSSLGITPQEFLRMRMGR